MQAGTFYLVSTPIGNLEDITYRAIKILQKVDLIAVEDTRHAMILLQHYHIKKELISLHDMNEIKRIPTLLTYLKDGKDVALISDAGTPLISDPGGLLVKRMRSEGINVVPIPGPCAAIAAICASGLSTDRFVFEGFLSNKNSKRIERLEQLSNEERTLIIYEAPHRILKLIEEIKIVFGMERQLVLVKELTKTFETFVSGIPEEIYLWLQADERRQKGEFVVLIEGATRAPDSMEISQEALHMLKILLKTLSVKQAVAIVAEVTGFKKNILYKLALEQKVEK